MLLSLSFPFSLSQINKHILWWRWKERERESVRVSCSVWLQSKKPIIYCNSMKLWVKVAESKLALIWENIEGDSQYPWSILVHGNCKCKCKCKCKKKLWAGVQRDQKESWATVSYYNQAALAGTEVRIVARFGTVRCKGIMSLWLLGPIQIKKFES